MELIFNHAKTFTYLNISVSIWLTNNLQ